MTTRILAADLPSHIDQRVTVAGWLHRRRQLKSVSFAILRDRSGLSQIVFTDPTVMVKLAEVPEETVLEVTGKVVANPKAAGGVEIVEPELGLLSEYAASPPFDLFRPSVPATLPTVLDHAGVALRHPQLRAPFEIAAASMAGFRNSLDAAGFTEVQTPKIVSSATESGANVFGIDYFGRRAYLAQSPQFFKQTLVGVFERVYEVAPVFRAEPHDTARHLAQYTSLDAEFGFIKDHTDVMAALRDTLAGMVAAVAERAAGAVALLALDLPVVPVQIPEVHFVEAQELIAKYTDDDPRGEPDLAPAHERWLCDWAKREFGSDFLFVVGYPMAKRPFYTHPDPNRPGYSNGFDLLFRGQELVTGGQRLHRYSDYLAALAARGESTEPYSTYLDAFKHGMPPHGGWAIGLERWVGKLTGASNIRQATLFPRDLHRLAP
ncbi:nondiscriminating aspartyl-tRNA synthetase [Streptomyces sp. 846.5]|nr:aspartate--tRNA(Asn) ligase [Streptomyces sp. 846.5]TDU04464.1 nondiscriminating aspartyl-tRNA synthetase [Streptomyces sp. 846.5]